MTNLYMQYKAVQWTGENAQEVYDLLRIKYNQDSITIKLDIIDKTNLNTLQIKVYKQMPHTTHERGRRYYENIGLKLNCWVVKEPLFNNISYQSPEQVKGNYLTKEQINEQHT